MAELMAAQVAAGADVAALVHSAPGQSRTPFRWHDNGALIDEVPCHGQLIFAPVSPSWPMRFARLLRDFKPQLLHLHVPNPSVFWLLALPAARRIPWIVHWHADIPEGTTKRALRLAYPPYRAFERALLNKAGRIVATSETYRRASRVLSRHEEKTRVIPLGLADAPPAGKAPEWPSAGLRVLAVGRLSYYKGFDVLLDAVAKLPQVSLLLVGSGEQRAALEQRIGDLAVSDRVRMAGNIDDATLQAAYEACDVFCLSSIDRAEAFGMVLLEAMRAGKPVVASDIPGSGVGSVVVDGETGTLAPVRDVDALVRALAAMAASPQMRERYGAAGHARWARDYRIDAVNLRWLELYRDVLATPTPG